MGDLHEQARAVDQLAVESGFSGAVRIDDGDDLVMARAYGLADRAHQVANTIDTRFAMASGSKAFTALAVMRLVEDEVLALDTTARSLLGSDLPLVDDAVTVEHLLAHRSGIGDYMDEDVEGDIDDVVMTRPVHELVDVEDFVPMLDGFPTKFAPDTAFSYCNGGFVLLALLAQRASGRSYHELVTSEVIERAGLDRTGFLRSDELPGDVAIGYLVDSDRTNVFHLPVLGSGDGGAYTTVADVRAFWVALCAGRVVAEETLAAMLVPRSDVPRETARYGLGFWLHESTEEVRLEGYDAGVSFRSWHHPTTDVTRTVVANDSEGTWPLVRLFT